MKQNIQKFSQKRWCKILGIFLISSLIFFASSIKSLAKGLSLGSSSTESPITSTSDIVNELIGSNSFSRTVINASNMQNSFKNTEGALARIEMNYEISSYAIPKDGTEPELKDILENKKEYIIESSPEKKGVLNNKFMSDVIYDANKDILKYSVKNETTHYWLTLSLNSDFYQNQMIKDGNIPKYTKETSVSGVEQVALKVIEQDGEIRISEIHIGNMELYDNNNFKANISYAKGNLRNESFADFIISIGNSSGTDSIIVTLPSNDCNLINIEPNRNLFAIEMQPSTLTYYTSNGDDSNLSNAMNSIISASNGEDLGILLETKEESSSKPESSESSSSKDNDLDNDKDTSKDKDKETSSKPESSENSKDKDDKKEKDEEIKLNKKSKLAEVSEKDKEKKIEESSKKEALSQQKNNLSSLSSKTKKDDGETLGGSLSSKDKKNLTNDDNPYLSLYNLDDKNSTTPLISDSHNIKSDSNIKYIFIFATVIIIIGSIPIAWKFVKKTGNKEFIG